MHNKRLLLTHLEELAPVFADISLIERGDSKLIRQCNKILPKMVTSITTGKMPKTTQ
jgi:hypothetical protein